MKKQMIAIISAFALIFSFVSVVSAAGAPSGMDKAIVKGLSDKHYDYKKNSLELSNAITVENQDPKLKSPEVVAAVATYKTIRDDIFTSTHKEIVFYSPQEKKMLTEQEVAKANPELTKYKKDHEDELGTNMDVVVVTLLLALVLLVPLYIMLVSEKRQYLTTKFKIQNNLYNQTKSFQ